MDNLILTPVPLEKLLSEITSIIRTEIIAQRREEVGELMLSGSQACKLFQPAISKVTLRSWCNQGLIPEHRIAGRVYYKQSEIMGSLKTLQKYKKPGAVNSQA